MLTFAPLSADPGPRGKSSVLRKKVFLQWFDNRTCSRPFRPRSPFIRIGFTVKNTAEHSKNLKQDGGPLLKPLTAPQRKIFLCYCPFNGMILLQGLFEYFIATARGFASLPVYRKTIS